MSDDDEPSDRKHPLRGFVICTTGIDSVQRVRLFLGLIV